MALLLGLSLLFASSTQSQTVLTQGAELDPELFRLERVPVQGGAELITIEARLDQIDGASSTKEWIPLVTVLRDTLGDTTLENDRLRYIWDLTYTRPTFWQKVSGSVPFLYTQVGSKGSPKQNPPPLMDLAAADRDVWNKICWTALQAILLDPYGTPLRASTRSYQRNISDFRRSHIIRALSLLALYQELGHEQVFTDTEMKEMQARLLLTDKPFGGFVDDLKLPGFYQKEATKVFDGRGHNWELLRQQAEANHLYFEPLEMPDGSATHVLLLIAKSELSGPPPNRFDGRFLNISNPWTDKRLTNWMGYTQIRWFDGEHRPVSGETPGARQEEMIPLALYGLDHPRIPALLVDFRDRTNPKHREMSRRALEDVTKNILGTSRFGDLPYFLGRSVFDFITNRRGMDINQPSRLRAYAQLKLLLSLNDSIQSELRSEITERLEIVSLNPLENGVEAERKLAKQQYQALLAYASRPDGLPAKLDRDRRAEMASIQHQGASRVFFRVANILTFGKYTHREDANDYSPARLDLARQLAYHTKFLREVALTDVSNGRHPSPPEGTPKLDVVWNMDEIKNSLTFIAEHGSLKDAKAVTATARIFARTNDYDTRRACLAALSQINNPRARAELQRISQRTDLDRGLRDLSSEYLSPNGRTVDPVSASSVGTGSPDR